MVPINNRPNMRLKLLISFIERIIEAHSSECVIFLAGSRGQGVVVVVWCSEIVHVQPTGALNITRVNILEHMHKYTHMLAPQMTEKADKRANSLLFFQLLTEP